MAGRRRLLAAVVIVIVVVAGLAVYQLAARGGGCHPPDVPEAGKYQAQKIQFGAVTEYCLANPSRYSNGIAVADDGSIWFGEQSLHGLGHLFLNGTVVEYTWPGYDDQGATTGAVRSSIWSVNIWNGRIWAADGETNRIIGLNPSDRSTISLNTTGAQFPYLLTEAPDGSIWFTALSNTAKLGKVSPDLSVKVFDVTGLGAMEPIQVRFANSSFGYLVALNPFNSTDSGLYSFDPRSPGPSIGAAKIGGDFKLVYPQALSLAGDTVWLAQHLPSNVVSFHPATGAWTVYPTSTVTYLSTSLPYFVEASGSKVWFNEHYGNKIGLLDPGAGTLTEFSESDPPVDTAAGIQNDLTIATAPGGLWFTSATGNYIGYVDGSYSPGFSVSVIGPNAASAAAGSTFTAHLRVSGSWSQSLQVGVSDSENYNSVPNLITIRPDRTSVAAGAGSVDFDATITVGAGLQPGRYTIAVTLAGGLLHQTAYVFLTVV